MDAAALASKILPRPYLAAYEAVESDAARDLRPHTLAFRLILKFRIDRGREVASNWALGFSLRVQLRPKSRFGANGSGVRSQ